MVKLIQMLVIFLFSKMSKCSQFLDVGLQILIFCLYFQSILTELSFRFKKIFIYKLATESRDSKNCKIQIKVSGFAKLIFNQLKEANCF